MLTLPFSFILPLYLRMRQMFSILGLLFTALLLSAGSSISDACNDDPEQCTPGKLCEIATEQKHGKLIWSTQSK